MPSYKTPRRVAVNPPAPAQEPQPDADVPQLDWSDVPPRVRATTVLRLLDTVACTVAGSATQSAAVARRWARPATGPGRYLVVGRTERLAATGAVAANATAADALDLDDGHRPLKGHPGAVVVPAALAAAQHSPGSGPDLLAGVLLGYEVALRAGMLLRAQDAQYHGSGAWAPVGAAAAVARLRGLDRATTATALAVAGFHAPMSPVMRTVDHPAMLKDGVGWGALVGWSAVDLAVAGITAPPLEAGPRAAPPVGRVFLVEDVYLKLSATCRWAQPAVRATVAALALVPAGRRVAAVRVVAFEAASHLGRRCPATTEEAQFSIPWAVACTVVDGAVGPEQVRAERLGDPALLAVAATVDVVVDPVLDARFPAEALARVDLVLDDGAVLRSPVCAAAGDPGDGTPDAAVADKARSLCRPVLGARRTEALLAAVTDLPQAADTRDLLAALRGRGPGSP